MIFWAIPWGFFPRLVPPNFCTTHGLVEPLVSGESQSVALDSSLTGGLRAVEGKLFRCGTAWFSTVTEAICSCVRIEEEIKRYDSKEGDASKADTLRQKRAKTPMERKRLILPRSASNAEAV